MNDVHVLVVLIASSVYAGRWCCLSEKCCVIYKCHENGVDIA